MKVKAKHWLKHDGVWYKGGDEFEVSEIEAEALKGMIEITEAPVHAEPEKPQEVTTTEQPKRRGRKPKAETAE